MSQETYRCVFWTRKAAGGVAKEKSPMTHSNTSAAVRTSDRSESLTAALVALLFGGALLFVTGFASPATIHNAAHDTRHTLSYPCH